MTSLVILLVFSFIQCLSGEMEGKGGTKRVRQLLTACLDDVLITRSLLLMLCSVSSLRGQDPG